MTFSDQSFKITLNSFTILAILTTFSLVIVNLYIALFLLVPKKKRYFIRQINQLAEQ